MADPWTPFLMDIIGPPPPYMPKRYDIVGFTGTKTGMTARQKADLRKWLEMMKPIEAHHGDCIGADAQFHDTCVSLGVRITIHPPINPKYRAFKRGDVVLPKKDYLKRDHDIVDAVEFMLAAPNSNLEYARSGTWATIRYAEKVGRKMIILWP